MTDIVYITGGKSFFNNNELRYSIRSLVKYLSNMGNIFIVGTMPDFLHTNKIILDFEIQSISPLYRADETNLEMTNVSVESKIKRSTQIFHIPAEDAWNEKKEPRLYRKRMKACRDDRISENALFMYDDEYLLAPHDADHFPNYYHGTIGGYLQALNGHKRIGHHKWCVENTIEQFGREAKLFDVHCPMLVNRSKFLAVTSVLDWTKVDGYLIKSSYGALAGLDGIEVVDTKLSHPDSSFHDYKNMISGKPYFTSGDNNNFGELLKLMEYLYPDKSPYES